MILQASRKAILGAMMFMAKRDPRYYLCGICFGPDKKLMWQSIYGAESWQANPWVWVLEFKRVDDEA